MKAMKMQRLNLSLTQLEWNQEATGMFYLQAYVSDKIHMGNTGELINVYTCFDYLVTQKSVGLLILPLLALNPCARNNLTNIPHLLKLCIKDSIT